MTKSKPILRTATFADTVLFYGKPSPVTFHGIVAELDSEIIGIAGVYKQGSRPIAFSDLSPALRKYRKTMVTACKMLVNLFDTIGAPVYAVANPNEPTAPYLLVRLGFKPTGLFGPAGETFMRD
jgi:hypothetical protein